MRGLRSIFFVQNGSPFWVLGVHKNKISKNLRWARSVGDSKAANSWWRFNEATGFHPTTWVGTFLSSSLWHLQHSDLFSFRPLKVPKSISSFFLFHSLIPPNDLLVVVDFSHCAVLTRLPYFSRVYVYLFFFFFFWSFPCIVFAIAVWTCSSSSGRDENLLQRNYWESGSRRGHEGHATGCRCQRASGGSPTQ